MKPPSILWASRCLIASIAFGLIGSFGIYAHLRDALIAAGGAPGPYLVTMLAESVLLPLSLWFFVFRRASRTAKWLLVALALAETYVKVSDISDRLAQFGWALFGVSLATLALRIAAAALLFTPSSRTWFARRGRAPQADAALFE